MFIPTAIIDIYDGGTFDEYGDPTESGTVTIAKMIPAAIGPIATRVYSDGSWSRVVVDEVRVNLPTGSVPVGSLVVDRSSGLSRSVAEVFDIGRFTGGGISLRCTRTT